MNPWPDEKALRRIDQEARDQSGGDVALWYHHQAILVGEYRAHKVSRVAFAAWRRSTQLPQYEEAEASVIEGWREYVENVLKIPEDQQSDDYAINREIIFDALRRAPSLAERARLLEERADSIRTFAASGDVEFFKALGRLLSAPPRSSLKKYRYAYSVLFEWLTGYLWLMPERLASDLVAVRHGKKPKTAEDGDLELRHFKEIKRDYKLKSHKPSLIQTIENNGDLIPTAEGRRLFSSLASPR